MNPAMVPLHTIVRLNTLLFRNCLVDVPDDLASRVVAAGANTMIFVAVHLFDGRIFMADTAGIVLAHPYPEIAAAERVQDISAYPPMSELLAHWARVSPALVGCLESLSEEQLQRPSPRQFPVKDRSLLGALSFLIQHETYHIGQLSLLRRVNGLSAMRYTENG